eukprot:TRINITY_DN109942_c0_g1_i1.p1 TRINITY_DN109942_c0_g1~~TRINITY_DN109942_c0_g1_i1.p1  ORF type:complete len:347 (+),score=47.85 TRINITY_DN109942_c0_g1_i1:74-1114(+)
MASEVRIARAPQRRRGAAFVASATIAAASLAVGVFSSSNTAFGSVVSIHSSLLRLSRSRRDAPSRGLKLQAGPFLVHQERKEPKTLPLEKQGRRQRKLVRENPSAEWKEVKIEKPIPQADEDGASLLRQIRAMNQAARFLPFLDLAVHSSGFREAHAVHSFQMIDAMRKGMTPDELDQLGSQSGLHALVSKTEKLLIEAHELREKQKADEARTTPSELAERSSGEDEDIIGFGPEGIATLLFSIARMKQVATLHGLVPKITVEGMVWASEMDGKSIVDTVYAISELKDITKLLQDELLPLIVQGRLIGPAKREVAIKSKNHYTRLRDALNTLRRDIPYLRRFLGKW